MSRIVSVWLPEWMIERLQRQTPGSVPEAEPFALIEKGPHGLRISAANQSARSAGVIVGAALPDVRAALPTLGVRPVETVRDRHALKRLAAWLGRYGPTSNVDGIDGAWVDITGVAHLFGGEPQLCLDMARRLGRLGFTVRIGLAGTLGAAHAIARFGTMAPESPWTIAGPEEARAVLGALPVAALRLEPQAVQLLVRLGLKRIGQLYNLPRASLAARFREAGPRGTRKTTAETAAASLLLRLDQALGLVSEPRPPMLPPPEVVSRLAFPEPLLTAEGVEEALRQLAGRLEIILASQALGAQRFRLSLYRADGTVARAKVGTSVPCRDGTHICRLMVDRLDNLDAGFGIDVMTLEAASLSRLGPRQIVLDEGAGSADSAAFLDRLSGRLGHARVRIWTACASHIPERSEAWRPAMSLARHASRPFIESREATDSSPAQPTHRPPLLLSPPEPISVIAELPEGAPQHFVWRRLARRIVRSEGPERIAPEWWRHIGASGPAPGTRDYYRLEDTTGARYWVFRSGLHGRAEESFGAETAASDAAERQLPRWFLHGLFA